MRSLAILAKAEMDTEARTSVSPARRSRILLICRATAPLLLVGIAFLLRQQLVDLIQMLSGLEFVFTVVHLYSTLGARAILGAFALAAFTLVGWTFFRWAPQGIRTILFACTCGMLVGIALWLLGRGVKASVASGLVSGVLVAANAMSSKRWNELLANPRLGPVLSIFFWICVGIEALLPRGYLSWIRGRAPALAGSWGPLRFMTGAVLAAAALATLAPFPMLMQMGQRMFMSQQATIVFGPEYGIFSRYDVSDPARNPANGDVLLCGDQQVSPKLLRHGRGPAVGIKVSNSGNEYCEFSLPHGFLTVDNGPVDDLLVIDPESLQARRRLRLADMPYGEIFLAAHPALNLVAVASEDEGGWGGGPDVRIVDLATMKVIREIDADVGYLIADARRPVIYTNHFAKDVGVRAWDMRTGRLLATSSRFGRSDRMAFDVARDEVLATAPELGEIQRFDAITLKAKPPIRSVFGVRGVGIDPDRDLLLASSFLTNELDVIDLKTGRSLRRYRLGPWLRDVLVVSEEGVAFVASRYGVFRVNYLR